jgi:hypothetical protein
MSTKTKKKVSRNGEVKPRKGKLGDIFGFPVTAVIRRLGLEGLSNRHIRLIVKDQKIKMPDHSIDVQAQLGKSKTRPAAPITQEQVRELKNSVPEPVDEPRAERKPKAKPTKKAAPKKSKKASKPKKATPAEESPEAAPESEPATA